MKQELASAYLALIPTLKGSKKMIESQLDGMGLDAVAKKKGEEAGKSLSKGLVKDVLSAGNDWGNMLTKFGRSVSGFGSKLTSGITKPALLAGTALAGIVAVKGFTRLKDIDSAKTKLEALGHSAAAVDSIMQDAIKSVKGTAYALNEAATTAAGAVAAGVKPGAELEGYLSSVADAAAVAGVSMEEMGSIFNRTQTAGRAYAMELNMLADRGIPIYTWVAQEAGITAEAVRKMAATGKLSSELYFKAIKKNIGGAAKEIGEKSFTGALQNIWASVARIGENFLDAGGKGGGFFTQIKPLMVEFKAWLGELEVKAKDFGYMFGEAFKVGVEKTRELIAVFTGASTETKSLEQRTQELKASVTSAFDWIIQKAQSLKMWYDGLGESSKKLVHNLPLIAVAAGPILQVAGGVIQLAGGFVKLVTGVGSAIAALPAFGSAVVAAVTNPVGAALIAVAGVAIASKLMATELQKNREAQDPLIQTTNALADANNRLAASKDRAAAASRNLAAAEAAEEQAGINLESAQLRYEGASKQVADAKARYGETSLEYRTALNQEKQALLDVETAQKRKNEAMGEAIAAKAEQEAATRSIEDHADRAVHAYAAQKEAFEDAQRTISKGFIHDIDIVFPTKSHSSSFAGAHKVGQSIGTNLAKGVADKKPDANVAGKGLSDSAVSGADGHSHKTHAIGVQLGQGLINGLQSKQKEARDLSASFISHSVAKPMMNAALIKSPSRVTASIGRFLGLGLVVGLKSAALEVRNVSRALLSSITDIFKAAAPLTFAQKYEEAISKAGQYQEELSNLNKNMPKQPVGKDASKSALAQYNKDLAKWKKDVADAAKGITTQYEVAGKNLAKAWAVGINKGVNLAKKGDTQGMLDTLDSLIDYTRGDLRTKLQSYRSSLESVSKTIEGLNDRLIEQKQALKDFRDGFKEQAGSYAADIFSGVGLNAQDYVAGLQERLKETQDYSKRMQELGKLGLTQAAIDTISAQGVEKGSEIAEALLKGADKETIETINALYNRTEKTGASLGSNLGKVYFQPGIDQLKSELETAKVAADKIGGAIATALKGQLDQAGGWGKTMTERLAKGISANTNLSVNAAKDLAAKVKAAATVTLPVVGANASLQKAQSLAVSKPAAKAQPTTNNNVFNVSIDVTKLADIKSIEDFIKRLQRAGGVYA